MAKVPEIFGSMVFNDQKMQERLPKSTYKALKKTIQNGEPLDLSVANVVAAAMKDWAVEMGCTHYTHWFQPLTGTTAEKHDSFISAPLPNGKVLMSFSGKELIKGEPDASSFPSGGLRATFEARGYTAWDPTSPAFIKDGTLYIPTAFCSYSGEALDKKTPLLRSMDTLNKAAVNMLHVLGNKGIKHVSTTVGPEQEYFLVDKDLYKKRKDLIFCGRTLLGASAPKGQEMEDHYFGALKPRVAAYMHDLDEELWKLGIPAKTKHNEVAPAQHELAPVFDTTNVAVDHNQLTMEVMKKVADKHNMVCLLHEKPFEGINGSGKHNNWSMSTTHENLLDPGDTPMENLQFLIFLAAVIKAVDEYADLLRTSVATPGNDHRLGANEAPPAIISIFVGEELEAVIDAICTDSPYAGPVKMKMDLGVDVLPKFSKDTTDRNRTSPFAFTGNRFEFRAAGSSANCAAAMIAINAAMANQLNEFKVSIDKLMEEGVGKDEAIFRIMKETIIASEPIRFEGDGYSEQWKQEAARRGLTNICHVPEALMHYMDNQSRSVLIGERIFNETELACRLEVELEKYTMKVQIESRVLGDLAINHIVPTAVIYQNRLLENLRGLRETFSPEEYEVLSADRKELVREISKRVTAIKVQVREMTEARKVANHMDNYKDKAFAYEETVRPYLESIRDHIDHLEMEIDDEIWPLPKYRELLFTK